MTAVIKERVEKDGKQKIDLPAQFMKLNRVEEPADQITFSASNNTKAVGGYDIYFGTYEVMKLCAK